MDSSSKKKSSIIFLGVIFVAILLLIFVVYRVTQNSSTIGAPNAAISCAYCDLAYDKNTCVQNCNAINTTNAGNDCPTGFTKNSVVRDDNTAFVGCKPEGTQIDCVAGTDCIGLVTPIPGYTIGCYSNKCSMEPIGNSRYWTGVLPKDDKKNWGDCGCGEAADNTVLYRCDATNPGANLKFSCSICGQDAAVVCPLNFVAKVDRVFQGSVSCVDHGENVPVSNVSVSLLDSKLKLSNATTDSQGKFSFSKTGDPESGLTYDISVTDTSRASPMPSKIILKASGFNSDSSESCLGVNSSEKSKTFCNSNCNKSDSEGYAGCTAGSGVSLGYNFSLGNCESVQDIPVYKCFTCDETVSPKAIVQNTQSSPCTLPSVDNETELRAVCL